MSRLHAASVSEIYRNIGLGLELFLTAEDDDEKLEWEIFVNSQLADLSKTTGQNVTISEFLEDWTESEFSGRVNEVFDV